MQIHHESKVSAFLYNIYKLSRELFAKIGVVTATTPFPVDVLGLAEIVIALAR